MMRLSCLYDDPKLKLMLEAAEQSDDERLSRLSRKQRDVLPIICDGKSNKIAAHELGISQRTLEQHRKAIMVKTGCVTFAELVRLYARAG
jgi:FixJ family two-component response regulator